MFATIGLRNQGWAITSKTFKFADFAALADVDENVLGANVEKTEKAQKKKPSKNSSMLFLTQQLTQIWSFCCLMGMKLQHWL